MERLTLEISIHTPARGVTVVPETDFPRLAISIHTPARGVTQMALAMAKGRVISIHTPARGVTWMNRDGKFEYKFQSTLPQGE